MSKAAKARKDLTKDFSKEYKDPRRFNRTIPASSVTEYFHWYVETLHKALTGVDTHQLERAVMILRQAIQNGKEIYSAGNGGSAAIADHLCCDWTKGTHVPHRSGVRTRSLVSNISVLTAFANDCGYENAFSKQLELLAKAGDVLVLVSSSGNSPNIVGAAKTARDLGMHVIALTGFSGGQVAGAAHAHLHVPFENYGIAEDGHEAIMHAIGQFLALLAEKEATQP